MPTIATPRYVLLDGQGPLGLELKTRKPEAEGRAIYGFSSKLAYDEFCASSPLKLRPYPLMKGYLKDQLARCGGGLLLVAVDAAGPLAASLNAATMAAVLESQARQAAEIVSHIELKLDPGERAYTVHDGTVVGELSAKPR